MEVEAGLSSHSQACSFQSVGHAVDSDAEVILQLLQGLYVDAFDKKRSRHFVELHTMYCVICAC
jgi:hypothetical protein